MTVFVLDRYWTKSIECKTMLEIAFGTEHQFGVQPRNFDSSSVNLSSVKGIDQARSSLGVQAYKYVKELIKSYSYDKIWGWP